MISVVLPVFNVEEYIEDCINSLLQQTSDNIEVVLVDDGGKDRSIELAKSLLERGHLPYKIVCKRNKDGSVENQGLSAARNLGILESTSEWVLCLDSDDRLHPCAIDLYERQMSNDVDFIFSNYLRVKLDDKLFETIDSSCCRVEFYDREQIAHAFLNRSITIICPSILVRKRFLVDKGLLYPEGCPFSEDQYFIWRLIAMSSSCVQICERLYYYVSRPSSIMNSSKIESFLGGWSWFSSLEKELEEIGGLPFSASIVADRWLLGALHTAAKLLSYDSFARFFNETKAKGRVGKQEWTNDKRAFVTVACIRLLPLPVVYQLLRNV